MTADVASVQRKFVSILCLSTPKIPSRLEATVVVYIGGFSNLYPKSRCFLLGLHVINY